MDKLAIVSIAVLSLIPNLNYQTPTLDTPRSDFVVSSFVKGEVRNKTFPSRAIEVAYAKQLDAQRETARLEALRVAEAQRQANIAQQAQTTPVAPVIASQADNSDAKLFIYMKESGNRADARNAGGCLGIGQACPGAKLLAVCPTLDYACEDMFFTNYMLARYKTWENAKAFWLAHHSW